MPAKKKTSSTQFSESQIRIFQKLHQGFSEIIAMEPWEIVHESVMLAVQHPQTGAIYYAYFMGALGQVVGFNLYDVKNAGHWLHTREHLEEIGDNFLASAMLTQTFLQCSADKKSNADEDVIQLHEAADIAIGRGKSGYLTPVQYVAGFIPEIADTETMQLVSELLPGLTYLLNQIEEGALDDPEDLMDEGEGFLAAKNERGDWTISVRDLPASQESDFYAAEIPEASAWNTLKLLPRVNDAFAVHARLVPLSYLNDEGRGVNPVMLICISQEKGMIIHFANVEAQEWKNHAGREIIEMFRTIGQLPKRIDVGEGAVKDLLAAAGAALNIPVHLNDEAATVADQAMQFLVDRAGAFA